MIGYDAHTINFGIPPGGWAEPPDFATRLQLVSEPRQKLRERTNIETPQVLIPSLGEYDRDPEAT